jgi:DNA mismatch repair ATPase MutS
MDFYLFEFILFLEFISEDQIFEWYPIFGEYRNRIAELPRLSSYLESDAQTSRAQVDLFAEPPESLDTGPSPLQAALKSIDPDSLTPREALDALYALKKLT